MLERIHGTLVESGAGRVVVDVSGFGLALQTPLTTFLALPPPPAEITLMTRLVIREESWDLFGFLTRLERESFDILTSVSRVGPKLALTIISAMEPAELGQALISQDLARLSAIKRIGPKMAERLIVELKDKAHRLVGLGGEVPGGPGRPGGPSGREEAVMALTNLGYSSAEAEKAVRQSLAKLGPGAELGDLVRESLRNLGM